MSANGDDNLEDLIREMVAEQRETNDLLRRVFTAPPGEEPEEEEGPIDSWPIGSTAVSVGSENEYRTERRIAAQSEDTVRPVFSPEAFQTDQGRIRAHLDLFLEGYHSLQSAESVLTKRGFNAFVRMLAVIAHPSDEMSVLIEFLEPSSGFFGLPIVEEKRRVQVEGAVGTEFEEVVVFEDTRSPFEFKMGYGNNLYWDDADPSSSLGLPPIVFERREGLVEWEPIGVGPAGQAPKSILEKLSTAVVRNNDEIPPGVADVITGVVQAMQRAGRPVPDILEPFR